jgi:hypothetical protein
VFSPVRILVFCLFKDRAFQVLESISASESWIAIRRLLCVQIICGDIRTTSYDSVREMSEDLTAGIVLRLKTSIDLYFPVKEAEADDYNVEDDMV